MTVRIEYEPGRLPAFWDRSVIFFANLMGLFYGNVGAIDELAAKIGGIETYGGRLCPLLNLLFRGPKNLLVLEGEPDASLLRYFADDVGLSLPEHVVLPHQQYRTLLADVRAERGTPAIERIAGHSAAWIDGMVTDDVLAGVAGILGKQTVVAPEVSRRSNNKLRVHLFLEQQGFPVFDTGVAERAEDIPALAARLRSQGYRRMVVKAQVGATGIGMLKLDTEKPRLEALPRHMFFEGPCLVQGWLNEDAPGVRAIGSPSVQMFFDDQACYLYDVTEQILSGESIHQGNIAPPPYWRDLPELEEPIRQQAVAVGRWLHEDGYRGTASADFLVVERAGRIQVHMCEVNARVTGATYPAVLARRLCPGGCWLMRNLMLDPPLAGHELLEALRTTDHLYRGQTIGGVLPINFHANRAGLVGKTQFLAFGGDAAACVEYINQAANVLPVNWKYSRD